MSAPAALEKRGTCLRRASKFHFCRLLRHRGLCESEGFGLGLLGRRARLLKVSRLDARGRRPDLYTAAYVAAYNGNDGVLKYLLEEGLLTGDCLTVTGKTLAENVAELPMHCGVLRPKAAFCGEASSA